MRSQYQQAYPPQARTCLPLAISFGLATTILLALLASRTDFQARPRAAYFLVNRPLASQIEGPGWFQVATSSRWGAASCAVLATRHTFNPSMPQPRSHHDLPSSTPTAPNAAGATPPRPATPGAPSRYT